MLFNKLSLHLEGIYSLKFVVYCGVRLDKIVSDNLTTWYLYKCYYSSNRYLLLNKVYFLFQQNIYLNKKLSYRREMALQGGLVMAKSWRLELEDNIYGHYPLWCIWPAKQWNSVKKMQNKGYYAVQGHSRPLRSVPIKSTYATSY